MHCVDSHANSVCIKYLPYSNNNNDVFVGSAAVLTVHHNNTLYIWDTFIWSGFILVKKSILDLWGPTAANFHLLKLHPPQMPPPITFTIRFCVFFHYMKSKKNLIRCETGSVFLPFDVKHTSATRHRWWLRWTIESKIKPLLAISDAGVLCSCQFGISA